MLVLAPHDDSLRELRGTMVPSSLARGVSYRLDRALGEGGMSVAVFALRLAPEGQTPVVLKILRPSIVAQSGPMATMVVQKEAVALGRLNEHVPPTPFVVRLIDTGSLRVAWEERTLDLPWLAVEYVHGGVEGTTLTDRVTSSLRITGSAFDASRAARAIDSVARGLTAVHEVGVIHRDIKPDNILCCGFGDDELFKVADFGVARPSGVAATFGGLLVGTPGFAPPELAALDPARVGPWTDAFSCACVAFFVLTGQDYFPSPEIGISFARIRDPARASILDSPWLSPELRYREETCRAIDAALARATAAKIELRPQSAGALSASLLPWLHVDSRRARPVPKRVDSIMQEAPTYLAGWTWMTRWNPGGDRVIRHAAWDGDGRCLAATGDGLAFWNGTEWRDAPLEGLPHATGVRFVHRIGAARWLVGGDHATVAVYTERGVTEVLHGADPAVRFDLFHGDLDDLAVLAGAPAGEAPALYALVGRRWLKPKILDEVASLTSLARIDDTTWLLTGRSRTGQGLVAVYEPLEWSVTPIDALPVRAFLASAGHLDRRVGLAVGAEGAVAFWDRDVWTTERVQGKPDLSAAGVDVVGRGWAAGAGRIWLRNGARRDPWACVWEDLAWTVPMVSVFADAGMMIGLTADGGIVEGRAGMFDRDASKSAETRLAT